MSEQTKLVLAIASGALLGAYGAKRAGLGTPAMVGLGLVGGFAADWAIRHWLFARYEASGEAQHRPTSVGDFTAAQRSAIATHFAGGDA